MNPPPAVCKCNLEPLESSVRQAEAAVVSLASQLGAVQAKLDGILAYLAGLDQLGREIKQRQDRAFTGRVFGVNFTLDVRKD